MIRLVTLLESIKHEVNIADVNIIKNEMYKAISKLGISSSNVSKLFKEYASLLENEDVIAKSETYSIKIKDIVN